MVPGSAQLSLDHDSDSETLVYRRIGGDFSAARPPGSEERMSDWVCPVCLSSQGRH